jgi:hypothetical protein
VCLFINFVALLQPEKTEQFPKRSPFLPALTSIRLKPDKFPMIRKIVRIGQRLLIFAPSSLFFHRKSGAAMDIRPSALFFFITALFLACQPADPGPRIFGDLYVRYLQDGAQLKAEASFFKGDSIHLAKPISILGGVSFQGSGMESRNIQDKLIRYKYEYYTDYPENFVFQAQDEEGKSYRFSLSMPPLSDFSLPDTLTLSAPCSLSIQPPPASANESLALLFTDTTGKASLVEAPAPISQTIILSPGQLQSLVPGLHQVYLVRKSHHSIKQGPFDLKGEVEYYSSAREVFVEAQEPAPEKED